MASADYPLRPNAGVCGKEQVPKIHRPMVSGVSQGDLGAWRGRGGVARPGPGHPVPREDPGTLGGRVGRTTLGTLDSAPQFRDFSGSALNCRFSCKIHRPDAGNFPEQSIPTKISLAAVHESMKIIFVISRKRGFSGASTTAFL